MEHFVVYYTEMMTGSYDGGESEFEYEEEDIFCGSKENIARWIVECKKKNRKILSMCSYAYGDFFDTGVSSY